MLCLVFLFLCVWEEEGSVWKERCFLRTDPSPILTLQNGDCFRSIKGIGLPITKKIILDNCLLSEAQGLNQVERGYSPVVRALDS